MVRQIILACMYICTWHSKSKGPFVKTLDNALQSFGVQQQYFGGGGGAFIGNHVHKALKVKCTCAMHVYVNNSYNLNIYRPNIQSLCKSISKMAQGKLPH